MTPGRWRTVERLYHAALERCDPRERAAFLDAECGGDAALRADVESLLAHDLDASSFMEAPAAAHLAADIPAASERAGTRLGPYQLGALIGAGGMGEVYKAADTRLGRDVAIKVLPAFWSSDPDRRARLEREARAIAAITHPNICTLYDVGRAGDVEYLVLEYVEGETLAERLRRGALPLNEALRVAGQMASALAAAHARGVIHRDLKPANVVLTRSGAKLLDFGLAKLAGSSAVSSLTQPTEAASLTTAGMILGTLQYMSPEQVEGQEADARSDIFAFGAVLHEMISGVKAFEGKTQASLIAAILERDPAPLPQLRPEAPPALVRVVRTCLAKDPAQRWQSAADLERELTWVREDLGSNATSQPELPARGRWRPSIAWGVAVVATALAIASIVWRDRASTLVGGPRKLLSLAIDREPIGVRRFPAISPDGRYVAFVEGPENSPGAMRLWLHDIALAETRPFDGTAGAVLPFWSPDSRAIAFFADSALKRLDLGTGSIQTLSDAPAGRGGTWGADGTIVFAPDIHSPLMRISAQGGPTTAVTRLDPATQDEGHRLPSFLPDGRHFVFTRLKSTDANVLAVGSLDSPSTTDIISGRGMATQAEFAAGKLLYVTEGALVAQAFDLQTLSPRGDRIPIVRRVDYDAFSRTAFTASAAGDIVYRPTEESTAQLAALSRDGRRLREYGEPGDLDVLSVSPDGHKLAILRTDPNTDLGSVWLVDVRGGQMTPVTRGADSTEAVWSADSKRILYSQREGGIFVYAVHALDIESGRDEIVIPAETTDKLPVAWLDDGAVVYVAQGSSGPYFALWRFRPGATGLAEPIETALNPNHLSLSTDGRWLAYASLATGRAEVYVQQFPGGPRQQVTGSGANWPHWSGDGRELFYLTPGNLNAAPIRTSPTLQIGAPVVLFQIPPGSSYVPSPDGRTFYVALALPPARRAALMMLQNGQPK